MKELRWEIGWLGCRPIKVLHFSYKSKSTGEKCGTSLILFVQRAPNTDSKMSSKEFQNDGAASRCSSELLSQSDVDNDNESSMYAYQKLTMHQRSHHRRSVVLRIQQPMLNYKKKQMINFPNPIWLIYYLGIPELDRLGWNTGKRVFPIHQAKMMKTRFLSRSLPTYRLSSLQGECLLLLDSTKVPKVQ